jgi:hypothetical protein
MDVNHYWIPVEGPLHVRVHRVWHIDLQNQAVELARPDRLLAWVRTSAMNVIHLEGMWASTSWLGEVPRQSVEIFPEYGSLETTLNRCIRNATVPNNIWGVWVYHTSHSAERRMFQNIGS